MRGNRTESAASSPSIIISVKTHADILDSGVAHCADLLGNVITGCIEGTRMLHVYHGRIPELEIVDRFAGSRGNRRFSLRCQSLYEAKRPRMHPPRRIPERFRHGGDNWHTG